jgi:hypothetical protein
LFVTGACGKKGNPLPPLRPVPTRILDLSAVRTPGRVQLNLTVPTTNLDGSTPVVIDHVDIYRMAAVPDTPPPPAGQVANPKNLRATLPVRQPPRPDGSEPSVAASTLVPAPGEVATYADDISDLESQGVSAAYYVAVPVATPGRGRNGPPTPIANVSLGDLPGAATDVALTNDERNVRVTWTPSGPGQVFRVYRVPPEPASDPELLTPEPLKAPEVSLPVNFGAELCVTVRTLAVSGAVTIEGGSTPPACLLPVDRYPPAAPTGVRVVQEGAAVTIIWESVDAADLAGYVVLRANGGDLEPVTTSLVRETTYRDTSVQVGSTYTYVVQAVDNAPISNTSDSSTRETITVR